MLPVPEKVSDGPLSVSVDPRIELLTAVQLMADYDFLITEDSKYLGEMEKHFAPYEKHNAVKQFRTLRKIGFNYDAPIGVMLSYSETLPFQAKRQIPESLLKRSGGQQLLDMFVLALEAGGYGPQLETESGFKEIYAVLGGTKLDESGAVLFNDGTLGFITHEFSHSFINPIIVKYRKQVEEFSSLYDLVGEEMRPMAYPTWEICVNEHIIRAITIRLAYLLRGNQARNMLLQIETNKGFYFIEGIEKKLQDYEQNRDKYSTLDSFYPQIIEVFREYQEQNLTRESMKRIFTGPVNHVFHMNMPFVLITSTNDGQFNDTINRYVVGIRDYFKFNGEVITDREALEKDLWGYNILAYGTMEGNLWLGAHKELWPFNVSPDEVVTETNYKETNLRLISAAPNPANPEAGLIIYTAQKAEDIEGINRIFHGPTDYIITRGDKVLEQGYYNKNKNIWTF